MNFRSTTTTPRGTITRDFGANRHWDGDVDFSRNVSWEPNENMYERRDNATRIAQERRATARANITARRAAGGGGAGPNNVYADRDGNVHRRSSEGWQRRQGGAWTRPVAPPPPAARNRRARSFDTSGIGLGHKDAPVFIITDQPDRRD